MNLSNKWLSRFAVTASVVAGLLLLVVISLDFWIPYKVQAVLQEKFGPAAVVEGRIDWFRWGVPNRIAVHDVRLKGAQVDPRMKASGVLDLVTVSVTHYRPERIMVKARELAVDIDLQAKSPAASPKKGKGPSISLSVDNLTVNNKSFQVIGQGFRHTSTRTCLKTGEVKEYLKKSPLVGHTFKVSDLCRFEEGIISVWAVEGELKLPPIPGLDDKPRKFRGGDGDIHPKEKRISFSNFTIEELVTFREGLSVRLQDDEKVGVSGVRVEVNHPWFSTREHKFQFFTLDTVVNPKDPLRGSLTIGPGPGADLTAQYDGAAQTFQMTGPCTGWDALTPGSLFKSDDGHFEVKVSVDPPKFHLDHSCQASCKDIVWPVRIQDDVFSYQAYKADGTTRFLRETGPGTKDWVSIQELPPYVPEAVITIEDPSFATHGGVLRGSLSQSLRDNLARGEFFRGGSTLTQQLAKNLFLHRDKTLKRKMDEAILALALEGCHSKPELMELYLNVVEFGPDLYGIGPASRHYFGKSAAELLPDEAFYLAKILPKPKSSPAPDEGGLAGARQLMVNLAKQGRIPESLAVFADSDVNGWDLME